MARSRTGLWWNIARNLGYHLALRNFGAVGFDPEGGGAEKIASKSKTLLQSAKQFMPATR